MTGVNKFGQRKRSNTHTMTHWREECRLYCLGPLFQKHYCSMQQGNTTVRANCMKFTNKKLTATVEKLMRNTTKKIQL
jgi:hypothetical protein